MNNRLPHSSIKQRSNKKADKEYNNSSKKRPYLSPHAIQTQQWQQSALQSPMPIRLIRLNHQDPYNPFQQDLQDIQQSVRNKLKQKKAYLPNIYSRQHNFKSLSPQSRSYDVSRHKLPRSSINKRLKAENLDHLQDQGLQDSSYYSTIIEINQINDKLNKQNRGRGDRSLLKSSIQNYKIDERGKSRYQKIKFSHPSRQQEFQSYVENLQKSYNDKLFMKNGVKDSDILQHLKYRVQTKKYNYLRYSRQKNPEASSGYQPFKERLQKKQQTFNDRYKQAQSFKNTKSQKINLQESRLAASQDEKQLQSAQQVDTQKRNKVRKQREVNDNFIKILRKVKNRGESLLIKLSKFPSKKLETQ